MKVSIIIPTYNSAEFILASVDSALNQSYKDREILVVDDGSSDSTRALLDEYVKGGKVLYFYQENAGPAKARNLGLEKATGELVAFLDADDIWEREKLTRQVRLFSSPEVGLVYSDMKFFGSGKLAGRRVSDGARFLRGMVLEDLIKNNFISTSTVVVRRELARQVGGFDEDFKIGEDYALWLRIARISKVDFCSEALVKYRIHGKQSSESAYKTYKSMIRLWKKFSKNEDFRPWQNKIKKQYKKSLIKMILRRIWPAHGIEA